MSELTDGARSANKPPPLEFQPAINPAQSQSGAAHRLVTSGPASGKFFNESKSKSGILARNTNIVICSRTWTRQRPTFLLGVSQSVGLRPQIWLSSLPLIVPLPWCSDSCPPSEAFHFRLFETRQYEADHTGLEKAHFVSIVFLLDPSSPPLPFPHSEL